MKDGRMVFRRFGFGVRKLACFIVVAEDACFFPETSTCFFLGIRVGVVSYDKFLPNPNPTL